MRYLTIRRYGCFAGCLADYKVYIEVPDRPEITIDGVPCRKLGVLKNGGAQTFAIDDGAARVFVIAGRMSKDFVNDFFWLPEGSENVFLSGRVHPNPFIGNPFRFDNNDTALMQAHRKSNAKKSAVLLLICAAIGVAIGVALGLKGIDRQEPKTFSAEGMQIELTEAFSPFDTETFTAAYDSRHVAVFALREPFDTAEGIEKLTLMQYASAVIEANELGSVTPQTADGLVSFVYSHDDPDNHEQYRYTAYVYKSGDAFWLVQFATKEEDAEAYAARIAEWAASVKLADSL